MTDETLKPTYRPQVFQVDTLDQAKSIILTPEDSTTEERWEKETPYLADEATSFFGLGPDMIVLDYGCGVGRMAKALIERSGCTVIGVDISQPMRQLAPAYVEDDRFAICARPALESMIASGLRVDAAIAVWILQHCPNVEEEIAVIDAALKPGGQLFVCNNLQATIPTDLGWVDTGFDIKTLLAESFEELSRQRISPDHVAPILSATGFIGKYRKKGD
jgi:cyclopropane fatty-acyl-phospholipid synthase-like methyltransferase